MGATKTMKVFIENESVPWEVTGPGIKRKVMAWDEKLMLVKVEFEQGAVGVLHQHLHTQISHVESGSFEIEIGEERKILKAGDVFYVPSNRLHGALCLQAGVLIDSFSPMREDFIGNANGR